MAATFTPKAWQKQWAKLMFNFFDYLPTKYEASPREWSIRKLIWDFKNGLRSTQVAEMVAKRMREQFGTHVNELTLVCIPASSSVKNILRYKAFSQEVARLTGCKNAFDAITIEGTRLAIHEYKGSKNVQSVEVINFDSAFFANKKVLIFDDVLTRGYSYARFACELERFGAHVIGGFFLGRTILI